MNANFLKFSNLEKTLRTLRKTFARLREKNKFLENGKLG